MWGYDSYLRWLYRSGRPNLFARIQNRFSAKLFAAGIAPRRVAALGVRGRRTGRVIWFPVVIAEFDGRDYLVSMLGNNANWVCNVAADDGRAVLRRGTEDLVHLVAVDLDRRAPILREYLKVAPGARPHVPIDRNAPLADFERIASSYPVFRIDQRGE